MCVLNICIYMYIYEQTYDIKYFLDWRITQKKNNIKIPVTVFLPICQNELK
jgi:hypothetical protein